MSKLYKNIFLILTLLNVKVGYNQNQYNITQYMVYQPFVNPASIATYTGISGSSIFRKQWVGIQGAPSTMAIAVNSKLGEKNVYLGGQFLQDNIGDNRFSNINLQFAYRAKLKDKSYLSLALKGGGNYYQSNFSQSYFSDANDPEFPNATTTGFLPNFGFGAMLFNPKYYVGFTIPTFLRYSTSLASSFNVNELHYWFNAGYSFDLNDKFDLNTSIFTRFLSGAPINGDINAQILYNKFIGLGINYRTSKEASAIFTCYLTKEIALSYAFDFTFSNFSTLSNGSHEIMLVYSKSKSKLLQLTSPRF